MNETTAPRNEVPEVTLSRNLTTDTVHVGRSPRSRRVGTVVTECNGRTVNGWLEVGLASGVTCKRCRKLVTL